jgi:hypothetical protein
MIEKKTMIRKKIATPRKSVNVSVPEETLPQNASKTFVAVDYPQEGEIITAAQYTLRLTSSAVDGVEVSIDGKAPQPCRESVGYWWFDWSGYGSGPHTVVARINAGKRVLKSQVRSFTVLM